jgi:DNA-directed RNA polymerase alpha subunit
MKDDFFDSSDPRSQDWLNSLSVENCNKLKHWLNKRIKYLRTIPNIKKKIEYINLSPRAYNALNLNNLHTVEDILRFGLNNLWKIRNIGAKTVIEIRLAILS